MVVCCVAVYTEKGRGRGREREGGRERGREREREREGEREGGREGGREGVVGGCGVSLTVGHRAARVRGRERKYLTLIASSLDPQSLHSW